MTLREINHKKYVTNHVIEHIVYYSIIIMAIIIGMINNTIAVLPDRRVYFNV